LRNLKVKALTAPVEMVVAMRKVAEAKQTGHIFQGSFLFIRRSRVGISTIVVGNVHGEAEK
jgi:hypothetical protein